MAKLITEFYELEVSLKGYYQTDAPPTHEFHYEIILSCQGEALLLPIRSYPKYLNQKGFDCEIDDYSIADILETALNEGSSQSAHDMFSGGFDLEIKPSVLLSGERDIKHWELKLSLGARYFGGWDSNIYNISIEIGVKREQLEHFLQALRLEEMSKNVPDYGSRN